MRPRFFLLLALILPGIFFPAHGQSLFERNYEIDAVLKEHGTSVEQTAPNRLVAVSNLDSVFNPSWSYALLHAFDGNGYPLWTKKITHATNSLRFDHIAAIPGGGSAALGRYFQGSAFRTCVARFDSAGAVVWSLELGVDGWFDSGNIRTTSDGNLLISGYMFPTGQSAVYPHFAVIKMDMNGSILFHRYYMSTDFGTSPGTGGDALMNADGGFTVCCQTLGLATLVFRTDAAGQVLWVKKGFLHCSFPSDFVAVNYSIEFVQPGYYIVCGNGPNNYWITCSMYDMNGNMLWGKYYEHGGMVSVKVNRIIPAGNNKFLLGGYMAYNTSVSTYAFMCELDLFGVMKNFQLYNTDPNLWRMTGDFCLGPGGMMYHWGDSYNINNLTTSLMLTQTDTLGVNACTPQLLQMDYDNFVENTTTLTTMSGLTTVPLNLVVTGITPVVSTVCGTPLVADTRETALFSLELFPNPASGELSFSLPDGAKEYELEIIDALSRTIEKRKTAGGKTVLDIRTYPPGIYFLSVRENNRFAGTARFIKD